MFPFPFARAVPYDATEDDVSPTRKWQTAPRWRGEPSSVRFRRLAEMGTMAKLQRRPLNHQRSVVSSKRHRSGAAPPWRRPAQVSSVLGALALTLVFPVVGTPVLAALRSSWSGWRPANAAEAGR